MQLLQGVRGEPYLDGGCTDIDECRRKDRYPCYGDCTNTPGSYICVCPPGTNGDATRQNGCRTKDKFTLALKAVTGVSVGVFLSVFMCFWLYLGLQKKKLIRTKQRFFEQNGGVILQQQMRSYSSAGAAAGGFKIFSKEELENGSKKRRRSRRRPTISPPTVSSAAVGTAWSTRACLRTRPWWPSRSPR